VIHDGAAEGDWFEFLPADRGEYDFVARRQDAFFLVDRLAVRAEDDLTVRPDLGNADVGDGVADDDAFRLEVGRYGRHGRGDGSLDGGRRRNDGRVQQPLEFLVALPLGESLTAQFKRRVGPVRLVHEELGEAAEPGAAPGIDADEAHRLEDRLAA